MPLVQKIVFHYQYSFVICPGKVNYANDLKLFDADFVFCLSSRN